jgi:hypothetical protein
VQEPTVEKTRTVSKPTVVDVGEQAAACTALSVKEGKAKILRAAAATIRDNTR